MSIHKKCYWFNINICVRWNRSKYNWLFTTSTSCFARHVNTDNITFDGWNDFLMRVVIFLGEPRFKMKTWLINRTKWLAESNKSDHRKLNCNWRRLVKSSGLQKTWTLLREVNDEKTDWQAVAQDYWVWSQILHKLVP